MFVCIKTCNHITMFVEKRSNNNSKDICDFLVLCDGPCGTVPYLLRPIHSTCRRKKKCIRYLPGEGDNSPHSADRSLIDSPPPSPVPWDSPSSPSDHAHPSPSLSGTSQIQPSVLLPKSESRGPTGMPQVVLRPPTISHPGTSGAS